MSNLLIYKNPLIFDRLDELGIDYTDTLTAYQIGFLSNTGMGIDRTVPSIFNLTPCEIPNYLTTKSFEDIVYERATELKNQGHTKVLVSGLSSLVIVKALENVGARPHVIMTDKDIHILDKVKHLSYDIIPLSELMNGNILKTPVITGCHGKFLYQYSKNTWLRDNKIDLGKENIPFNISSIIFNVMNIGLWYKKEYHSKTLEKYYADKTVAFRNIEEYLYGLIDRCPFKIENKFDFYWWLSFTLRWYSLKYRFTGLTGNISNSVPFFDTLDFQSWSIINHQIKSRNTFSNFLRYEVAREPTNILRYYSGKYPGKTTWLISFADSEGQTSHESVSPTIDQVRSVLKTK